MWGNDMAIFAYLMIMLFVTFSGFMLKYEVHDEEFLYSVIYGVAAGVMWPAMVMVTASFVIEEILHGIQRNDGSNG